MEIVEDYAVRRFRELRGATEPLPSVFVPAHELSPQQHLLMQACLQRHVDASISKTVNCPKDIAFEDFENLYLEAHRLGLKGCTAYRPNEITGAVLATPAKPEKRTGQVLQPPSPASAGVRGETPQPQAHPPSRPGVLSGFTYKLKWPGSDHAIYVTINDTIEGDSRRPFEIFINSKNLEHYAWTVALTRMISAIFRRGGDVSFVVEELKAVFDPRGGAWMSGKYVPSLLAAIGDVIDQHFRRIGFYEGADANVIAAPIGAQLNGDAMGGSLDREQIRLARFASCPKCGSPSVIFQEGCLLCRNCGYSSCG
jgi:ribonucleoside-diphosphate reductase alpha chain